MKISYNWIQEYFKKPLPKPDMLAELFNAHAFEVDGIEKQKKDTVLDLKVLPDRAHYALCHRGVAREVSVITGLPLEVKKISLPKVQVSIAIPQVRIDSNLCSRYMACQIDTVSIKDSPVWLKEKLEAVGARAINTVVDATNYVMLDVGQPLHAFDADLVKGTIVVRNAKKDEKITLLDGREVVLTQTDLVIADDVGPLAIAGVKGGKRAEVTTKTKAVIIESANFSPTSVRKTATRLNLRNDSSKRFENAISPELCPEALERVSALISELSKGALVGPIADMYPRPTDPWTVSVPLEQIISTVGAHIPQEKIVSILKSMNCVVEESAGILTITPPYDRLDLIIPEDIADEAGRIYGYDHVPSVLPPVLHDHARVDKHFYYAEKVKNMLVERGYSEVLLYSLVSKGAFEIAYPLASDKSALRESITPKLQEALVMNARNADLLELDAIKIFEIGKIFPQAGEKLSLCFGVSLIKKKKGTTAETVILEDMKAVEATLGIKINSNPVSSGQDSIVEIDFAELVKTLPEPKDISDLGFTPLPKDKKYVPFSHYPFSSRDVAVFVPKDVSEETVAGTIRASAGKYLLKMRLFDVFTKDNQTSYAYRLIFQSYDKTLEEGEINGAMEAVTKALGGQVGWKVR